MTSIDRPLAADVLVFHLADERTHASDPAILARSGRNARTLLKDGALRVTLITLAAGGAIAEHHATGPITVHVLDGALRFGAAGTEYSLDSGDLLSLGAGIHHSVASDTGATFLLTIGAPPGSTHQASTAVI